MEFVARTNVGKVRSENQDSACVFAHAGFIVGIVADGMGGHKGGAAASSAAISCVKEILLKNLDKDADEQAAVAILKRAYAEATAQIYARSTRDADLSGMGTTLTVALLRAGRVVVSNIGDSRAYLSDKDQIRQLTVDQTLVQRLIDNGEITTEEAKTHPQRHVILEAVGTCETIVPEIYTADTHGKAVLLCSDGLTGEVEDAQIHKILLAAKDMAQAADELVRSANASGGEDNITVALLSE